jgi:hypothetical protein
MASQYVKLPYVSGSAGAVDSFNGRSGIVISVSGDYSASQITNSPSGNISATDVQAAIDELDTEKVSTAFGQNNKVLGTSATGDVQSIPNWSTDATTNALTQQLTVEPDNNGGNSLQNFLVSFNPLQNSPNETWSVLNNQVAFDTLSSGFNFGTSGGAVNLFANYLTHLGTGDIGGVSFFNNNFDLGNGTDPISIKGISISYGFGSVHANATINGPIQGYGFQFNSNASATLTGFVQAFYDFANLGSEVPGYNSFSAGPTIASIANNSNYNGLNLSATIPTFTGNAGFAAIAISPTLGTFDTGSTQIIQINPTITSSNSFLGLSFNTNISTVVTYAHIIDVNPTITTIPNGGATGIYVNMTNVAGTGHKAMDINGDVNINGAFSFTGALSIGKLNAYYSQAVADGGGTPATIHSLISSITAPASATVANADTIGVNTASLITIGANAVITSAFLGLAALALPAVVQIGASATVDLIEGAVFAISLDSGAGAGGVIDTVALCRSVAIPNGITTINKLHGYDFTLPFGDPGTETWGFYTAVDCYNWFKGSLKIGGTAGSTDKVTNSSVGLEIESTTQAFLNARMTTTQRDALTALNGMQIYNTTTDKLQVYAAGVWTDLH